MHSLPAPWAALVNGLSNLPSFQRKPGNRKVERESPASGRPLTVRMGTAY